MVENKSDRREADEQVDEILKPHPLAEQEVHDIPVAAQITANAHETPVKTADDDDDESDTVH